MTSPQQADATTDIDPELLERMLDRAAKALPKIPTLEELLADPHAAGRIEQSVQRLVARGDDPRLGLGGGIDYAKMHALADLPWTGPEEFRRDLWRRVLTPQFLAKLIDRTNGDLFGSHRSLVRQAVAGLPAGRANHIFKRYQIGGYTAYASDEDSFAKARVACRDALADGRVKFMTADVRDLPLANLGEFDAINLSNIVQYKYDALGFTQNISRNGDYNWPDGNKTKRAQDIINAFVWPVAEMLAPGGRMMASYTYSCGNMGGDPLRRKRSRQALFKAVDGFSVEEHAWQSMSSEGGGDDVAVIVKRDQ